MNTEPSKELRTRLAQLAAAVEIVEIRPLGFLARLLRDVPPPDSALSLGFDNKLSVINEGEGRFVVRADFKLTAHPEADARAEFLKLSYTIFSRYQVPPEHPLEQEVLEFFANTNGMVHLWPYLRAFVANSCAQMGVMPITLPPFRAASLAAAKQTKKPASSN